MIIFNILDIAKTGPGSKMIDRIRYFGCLIKIKIKKPYLTLPIM